MLIKKMFGWESVISKVERAKSPTTAKDELLKLACDSETFIRIYIAHRNDIDGEIIDILIADKNVNVRFAVINNMTNNHIPVHCLNKLCEDDAEFIKEKAKEIIAEREKEEGFFPSLFLSSIANLIPAFGIISGYGNRFTQEFRFVFYGNIKESLNIREYFPYFAVFYV